MDASNLEAFSALTAVDRALVQAYLAHVRWEKRLAERTAALYTLDLQALAAAATQAGLSLAQVQAHHVRRWVAQMHAAGRSPRGIALRLSGWRGFYAWLGREGVLATNPVLDVRAPKAGKPLPKALGVDDAVRLARHPAAEQDHPWLALRDAAMTALLYGGGLRLAELLGLDAVAGPQAAGWLDLQEGVAHVLGKGRKRRSVPVGAAAVAAVRDWLAVRPQVLAAAKEGRADEPALFVSLRGTRLSPQSVWQRLRQRGQRAGLPVPVHPHMLRHSMASHVLQSSGDLRGVQELLGHAHIQTTQVYTRLDFGHLARVYDAAHPRAHRKASGGAA